MKMISKEDLFEALGIEPRGSSWMLGFVGFGLGAICGSVVTLLLAPKSGEEFRQDILGRTRKIVQGSQAAPGPTA
jgi:hypothetical protein